MDTIFELEESDAFETLRKESNSQLSAKNFKNFPRKSYQKRIDDYDFEENRNNFQRKFLKNSNLFNDLNEKKQQFSSRTKLIESILLKGLEFDENFIKMDPPSQPPSGSLSTASTSPSTSNLINQNMNQSQFRSRAYTWPRALTIPCNDVDDDADADDEDENDAVVVDFNNLGLIPEHSTLKFSYPVTEIDDDIDGDGTGIGTDKECGDKNSAILLLNSSDTTISNCDPNNRRQNLVNIIEPQNVTMLIDHCRNDTDNNGDDCDLYDGQNLFDRDDRYKSFLSDGLMISPTPSLSSSSSSSSTTSITTAPRTTTTAIDNENKHHQSQQQFSYLSNQDTNSILFDLNSSTINGTSNQFDQTIYMQTDSLEAYHNNDDCGYEYDRNKKNRSSSSSSSLSSLSLTTPPPLQRPHKSTPLSTITDEKVIENQSYYNCSSQSYNRSSLGGNHSSCDHPYYHHHHHHHHHLDDIVDHLQLPNQQQQHHQQQQLFQKPLRRSESQNSLHLNSNNNINNLNNNNTDKNNTNNDNVSNDLIYDHEFYYDRNNNQNAILEIDLNSIENQYDQPKGYYHHQHQHQLQHQEPSQTNNFIDDPMQTVSNSTKLIELNPSEPILGDRSEAQQSKQQQQQKHQPATKNSNSSSNKNGTANNTNTTNNNNNKSNGSRKNSLSYHHQQQQQQYHQSQSNPKLSAVAIAAINKKNTSRRNAWGNMSYADLITRAINGSPDKRLTLAQIYEWMVQNVGYFKDKGDSNSSAGWKNSIRHNLSLHNRFMRVQNEGTGKSSWWMINPDAKPGKMARRRAISMETHNYEKRRGRVKKRVEQMRSAAAAASTLRKVPSESSSTINEIGNSESTLSLNNLNEFLLNYVDGNTMNLNTPLVNDSLIMMSPLSSSSSPSINQYRSNSQQQQHHLPYHHPQQQQHHQTHLPTSLMDSYDHLESVDVLNPLNQGASEMTINEPCMEGNNVTNSMICSDRLSDESFGQFNEHTILPNSFIDLHYPNQNDFGTKLSTNTSSSCSNLLMEDDHHHDQYTSLSQINWYNDRTDLGSDQFGAENSTITKNIEANTNEHVLNESFRSTSATSSSSSSANQATFQNIDSLRLIEFLHLDSDSPPNNSEHYPILIDDSSKTNLDEMIDGDGIQISTLKKTESIIESDELEKKSLKINIAMDSGLNDNSGDGGVRNVTGTIQITQNGLESSKNINPVVPYTDLFANLQQQQIGSTNLSTESIQSSQPIENRLGNDPYRKHSSSGSRAIAITSMSSQPSSSTTSLSSSSSYHQTILSSTNDTIPNDSYPMDAYRSEISYANNQASISLTNYDSNLITTSYPMNQTHHHNHHHLSSSSPPPSLTSSSISSSSPQPPPPPQSSSSSSQAPMSASFLLTSSKPSLLTSTTNSNNLEIEYETLTSRMNCVNSSMIS